MRGDQFLLLLAGGSKSTQANDITKALELNRSLRDQLQRHSYTLFSLGIRRR